MIYPEVDPAAMRAYREAQPPRTVPLSATDATDTTTPRIDPRLVRPVGHAELTARLLDLGDAQGHGYAEEWAEPAILPDGRPCARIYLFFREAIRDVGGAPLEAEDYPWDEDHIHRIKLVD